MIGWKFPDTGFGMENGKNDPGIETFRGSPYPSLARETIQNSLDAKRIGTKDPVIVKYELIDIPSDIFPDKEELKKVLKLCVKEAGDNEEATQEFEKAINTLNKETITFLRISDFNTTGLSGSDKLRKTDWHRLVKSVGDTDKNSTSQGAFGIGKHAPFACSDMRTVFYGTIDNEGKKAFQGVSKLMTHVDELGNPKQGTGFFGEKEYLQPIKDEKYFNPIFYRNDVGTDVFVAGFRTTNNWKEEILKSVLDNFFVSLYEGQLEVIIEDIHLNKQNVVSFIEEYIKDDPDYDSDKYIEALTSSESKLFIEEDFEGLGEVRLFLINNPKYHKKIAMVRKSGMLIREKPNYNTPIKYAGVLLIKGEEFNKLLKKIEDPSHKNWEFSRHPDPKKASRIINKLYNWMNNNIKALSPVNNTDEYSVDELGQFLPDDLEVSELINNNTDLEGEKGKPININLSRVKKDKRYPTSNVFKGFEEVAVTTENRKDTEGNSNPNTGDNYANPDPRPNPSPNPDSKPFPNDINFGNEDETRGAPSTETKRKRNRIKIQKVFCTDPESGIYQVRLDSTNSGTAFVEVIISGEEDNEPAVILNASNQNESINTNDNIIGPIKIQAGKNSIKFKLQHAMRVRLGVSVYEG